MPKPAAADSLGHYRALKVNPAADVEEIRLAYAMAKQTATGPYLRRVEDAYEVLKDARRRAAYDRLGGAPSIDWGKYLKSPWTLVVCVAILSAAIALIWVPDIRMRSKHFQAGQVLTLIGSGSEFGEVVRVDPAHRFPQGLVAPAYLVRLAGGSEERWYPEVDLQSTCVAN